MTNNIPIWIQYLIAIQKRESKKISSRWIQLSTIGLDNSPRVRTVVFRGWSKNYEMEILTDQRSEKFKELQKLGKDPLKLIQALSMPDGPSAEEAKQAIAKVGGFCPSCGYNIPDDLDFCEKCGDYSE